MTQAETIIATQLYDLIDLHRMDIPSLHASKVFPQDFSAIGCGEMSLLPLVKELYSYQNKYEDMTLEVSEAIFSTK